MNNSKTNWHPLAVLCFWLLMSAWILFVLTFFGSPGGILGWAIDLVADILSPKSLTLVINSFAIVGAYVVTRLLAGFRIGLKAIDREMYALAFVIWIAVTGFALVGARCDIFLFCADDITSSHDCEPGSDRQGLHCR